MIHALRKLKEGLKRTQSRIRDHLTLALTGRLIDEKFWDELVEVLLSADIHLELAEHLIKQTRKRSESQLIREPLKVLPVLIEILAEHLTVDHPNIPHIKPMVIFFVGVNGTGKTTTIAKLAHLWKQNGESILLAACDTFRAAAIEQLETWAHRIGVKCIHQQEGSDPSAVLYDALDSAKARKIDRVLVDTAGRLHTKSNLMKELEKMARVAQRQVEQAPHEIFLVLDATIGKNALNQARVFKEATNLTGIILTKLDGTAKGGAVFSIVEELQIPVRYIGVGERIDDILTFDPHEFARTLIGSPEEWREELEELEET